MAVKVSVQVRNVEVLLPEVDRTGIEPVTPTMSMWCSTAEPTILAVRGSIPHVFNTSTMPNCAI